MPAPVSLAGYMAAHPLRWAEKSGKEASERKMQRYETQQSQSPRLCDDQTIKVSDVKESMQWVSRRMRWMVANRNKPMDIRTHRDTTNGQ